MNNRFVRFFSLFYMLIFFTSFIFSIMQMISNKNEIIPLEVWIRLFSGPLCSLFFYYAFIRYIILNNNSIIINIIVRKIKFSKKDVQRCIYSGRLGIKGYYFMIFLNSGRRIAFSVTSKKCNDILLDFLGLDTNGLNKRRQPDICVDNLFTGDKDFP